MGVSSETLMGHIDGSRFSGESHFQFKNKTHTFPLWIRFSCWNGGGGSEVRHFTGRGPSGEVTCFSSLSSMKQIKVKPLFFIFPCLLKPKPEMAVMEYWQEENNEGTFGVLQMLYCLIRVLIEHLSSLYEYWCVHL